MGYITAMKEKRIVIRSISTAKSPTHTDTVDVSRRGGDSFSPKGHHLGRFSEKTSQNEARW